MGHITTKGIRLSEASHPLLAVQEHDAAIDQRRHERETLPERTVIAEATARRGQVEAARAGVEVNRSALAADQKRREDEVAILEAKIKGENEKLYGGAITSPKEAQAIQEELESLARHQDHLETALLEVMDQLEPLTEQVEGFDTVLAELAAEIETASASLVVAESEIDEKVVSEEAARAEAVKAVDPANLATYEDLRRGFGGSAVVTFDGNNCVGCPMLMPAMVLDLMKKADPGTVNPCSECGRLVVK